MKKIIIVLGVISLVVAAALCFALLTRTSPAPVNNPVATTTTNIFPDAENIIPDETEPIIETNDSEVVATTSFLQHPSVKKDETEPGYYYLGNTFMPDSNGVSPNYVITYDEANKFFNVTLLREPLNKARFEAESYLRSVLNLSDAQICALEYTLSTPGYVNEEMSGIDYRFSFCSDALVL